ncbi:MAG: ATP-binding cassette domain-containing protein [Polyangiaceae bacterium]|jgi:lipopolysaccharide export system ATP-binding protein
MTASRLVGEGLHVVRGGKDILRGIDLEVRSGEVLAVLGPSGAGKSTLFRALVGELPAKGRVLFDGADVSDWPLWRRSRAGVGYVPQTPSVLWNLTVRGNLLAFHRIVHGEPGDTEAGARRVELEGRLDVPAGELSAGERRRLELARALVRPPRVLICDEPFAGVDPVGSAKIAKLLQGLAHDGVAIVLADHHVAEALALATRAMLLLDGRVATAGDPASFQDDPLVRGRYLGSWSRTAPPPPPRQTP